MSKMVRGVFFTLMAVIIAAILYFILFGTAKKVESETYEVAGGWRGALFYASETVESSISRYYYMYCYLPSIQLNDRIDELLGFNSFTPTGTSLNANSTSAYVGSNPHFSSSVDSGGTALVNYH